MIYDLWHKYRPSIDYINSRKKTSITDSVWRMFDQAIVLRQDYTQDINILQKCNISVHYAIPRAGE